MILLSLTAGHSIEEILLLHLQIIRNLLRLQLWDATVSNTLLLLLWSLNHEFLFFHIPNYVLEVQIFIPDLVHLFLQLIHLLIILILYLTEVTSLALVRTCHRIIVSLLEDLDLGADGFYFSLLLR